MSQLCPGFSFRCIMDTFIWVSCFYFKYNISQMTLLKIVSICLFLAMLCLHCCAGFSPVVASGGCSLAAVHGLFTAVVSLVEHRLQGAPAAGVAALRLGSCSSQALEHRLNSCGGAWAQLLHSMWDLLRSGIEPISPALAGEFFTTEPPGKSPNCFLFSSNLLFCVFLHTGLSLTQSLTLHWLSHTNDCHMEILIFLAYTFCQIVSSLKEWLYYSSL